MDVQAGYEVNAESRSFRAALMTIYGLMSGERKRQLWLVFALTLVGGIAELCTIGAIIPFLSLLASPDAVRAAGLAPLFDLMGASTREQQLVAATGLFIAAALASGAVRLILAWSSQGFVHRLGHDLTMEIQRRILSQPYAYHLAHNSSEVIGSLEQVHQLSFGVVQQLIQAAAAAVMGLFIFAAIAAVDLPVALGSALVFGSFYALIIGRFRRRMQLKSQIIAAGYAHRVQVLQESIGGIRDAIVDQAQAAHLDALRSADASLTEARISTARASTAPRYLIESVGIVFLALIALLVSSSAGGLASALPVVGALALAAQRLLPLANQLYQGWTLTTANRDLALAIVALLRLPTPPATFEGPPIELREAIRFDNVTFEYPGRRRPALNDLSLEIPRGHRIALTGPTGSGKSTFADLLMGLLSPTRGKISIDGTVLDVCNRASWQRSVSHVPQSIFLVDASIGRNIALSLPNLPIDPVRLERAAATAQLDGFIRSLPDGFDTIVGERGVRLSGGQRQRLGIARALYKQAPVLILDEATSALDEETETAVVGALEAIPGLTVLVIAHRRSTIERCNTVLRLENGKLVTVTD